MKLVRTIASAGLAMMLLAALSDVPLADEAIGTIVSIDGVARTVTLDNGQTFVLAPAVDLTSIEIGQHVIVLYEPDARGINTATEISGTSA